MLASSVSIPLLSDSVVGEGLVSRVDDIEGAATGCGPPLRVDEQLAFSRLVHVVSPLARRIGVGVLQPSELSVCPTGSAVNVRVVHEGVDRERWPGPKSSAMPLALGEPVAEALPSSRATVGSAGACAQTGPLCLKASPLERMR
jgi:hypothetical protein